MTFLGDPSGVSLLRLLNVSEALTDQKLGVVCKRNSARVFPKIRVADVLPINNSGVSTEEFSYALKAHFDFVVTDEQHYPLFVVEFDGPSHTTDVQKARDAIKDRLCKRFRCPFLRIDARCLEIIDHRMDMLTWLVEMWFTQRAFLEAQTRGEIRWDEPFSPALIISDPDRKESFPFWLSGYVGVEIQKLHASGRSHWFCAASATGYTKETDEFHGIAYILLNESAGVLAEASLKTLSFFFEAHELVDDLAMLELWERIKAALINPKLLVPKASLESRCESFRRRVHVFGAAGPVPNALNPDRQPDPST